MTINDAATVLQLGSQSCFPGLNSTLAPAKRSFSHVALVSMPWGSVRKPALAIPILKRCAQRAGFTTQVYPLTIRMAEMVGIDTYEQLSDRTLYPEWFFSQYLFGLLDSDCGMKNGWDELRQRPDATRFSEGVLKCVGDIEPLLRKIAEDYVPRFIDECVSTIPWGDFGAVGFSSTFAQNFASATLAMRIKDRYPNVRILFGGANVDGEMGVEFLKAFPWVDCVVHGEGEVAFPNLLDALARGSKQKVAGVSTRTGPASIDRGDTDHPAFVDLNESPVPDYSDYISALRGSSLKGNVALHLSFESSRGCWWGEKHHCTFCGLNLSGMAHRQKDVRRVFNEILEITATTKSLNLCATDNILPLDYLQQLMPMLAEADLDLNLFYETKANLNRSQIAGLARAGVRRIQPGIESFTTRLLAHMKKGITAIQNIQFVKWCRELGISANYNLLYGFPGETAVDYEAYPMLFRSLQHLQPPSYVTPVVFQRFSPYDFNRNQFGLELEADEAYQYLYPSGRISLDRIAYYFQDRSTGPHIPPAYAVEVISGVEKWQKSWRKAMFAFSKGPGFIVLHDSRHLTDGEPEKSPSRHYTIPDPGASIYLMCDQHRSISAIKKMVREKFEGRYSDATVDSVLARLTERQFMYHEDGKYLALAIRSGALAAELPWTT